MRRLGKKGNALAPFMTIVVGIAIGVVTIAVLAILINALHSSSVSCLTGNTYNSTDGSCQNASGTKFPKTTTGNITDGGLSFLANTSAQFGTSGTVTGVSLLLLIIGAVGVGAWKVYENYR